MTEKLNDNELQEVSGGYGERRSGGYWMGVGHSEEGYVALRPQPYYDPYHEFAQLYPGCQVYTYGSMTGGTGRNGSKRTYMYVCFQGTWGWVDASCLY